MTKLSRTLSAWKSDTFSSIFIEEILSLSLDDLPLQKALCYGNYATMDKMSVMVLKSSEADATINVSVGIFFTSIITGCPCADDPTPGNQYNEYCELQLLIDKNTANTQISLLS